MERRIFVVLLFMATVAAYGSDRSVRSMSFEAQKFGGPVCYPGDPCGPHGVTLQSGLALEKVMGPVCYPGDSCGWPGSLTVGSSQWAWAVERLGGPVCYPGDPCGPGGRPVGEMRGMSDAEKFGGPVCYPGDPCGPGGAL